MNFYEPNQIEVTEHTTEKVDLSCLRFSNGEPMRESSRMTRLAMLVIENPDDQFEFLTSRQRRIISLYRASYKATGTFPTHSMLEIFLRMDVRNISQEVRRILELTEKAATSLVSYGNFYREAENIRVLTTLKNMYAEDPTILTNPNLSSMEMHYLSIIFSEYNLTRNIFPSMSSIAKRINKPENSVWRILDGVILKLQSGSVYYDKYGRTVPYNDIRIKLLNLGGLEKLEEFSNARPINKKIISMMIETQEGKHIFKYSTEEIATQMKITTTNWRVSITHMIEKVMKGEKGPNLTLVDENGYALTRNHLRVVELLLIDQLSLEFKTQITSKQIKIARMLLKVNEDGRYFSYETIANELGTVEGHVTNAVDRIIEVLENMES